VTKFQEPLAVPGLGPVPKPKKINSTELLLDNGLNLLAVRRAGVPMVEVRLRIPFQSAKQVHPAQATLLSDSILAGTASRDRESIASAVQEMGGTLNASVDADRLLLGGSALAVRLPALVALVGEVLTSATYPAVEVARDRARLIERLSMARSQASVIAHEALAKRMWGDHPYALDLPQPAEVDRVTAAQLRRLHSDRVNPDGATLIIVGDISPGRVVDQVAKALAGWTGSTIVRSALMPPLPVITAGPPVLVDRPGSVQSALRLAGEAVERTHPDAPALALANLIFGGYFSSRWVENIREDKGYTYSPRSGIEQHQLGAIFTASADVATEVTAPALLETQYELGRIASLPVTVAEVDAVRQYAIGTLALSVATQSGLASNLSSLAASGLGLQWLAEQPVRMAAVTVDQVTEAAAKYLAPSKLVTVIVGDAASIAGPLSALTALAE
jgi:predicted Zn-dependent peptidase